VAALTVKDPFFQNQPANQTNDAGDTVSFSVVAGGSAPFTYQWRKDGFILSGATTPSLTITNAQPPDIGAYDVVVANAFGAITSRVARLFLLSRPDSFNPEANNSVCTIAAQADGQILVGGEFMNLGGESRNYLARINNLDPATDSLNFNGSTITWLRGGAAPEISQPTADAYVTETGWTNLGIGTRISGGWQWTGLTLSADASVRARGTVTGGFYNGSSWIIEKTAVLTVIGVPAPQIIVADGGFGIRSNQFGFNVGGQAGQTVIVEGSTNLLDWKPLFTNTIGSGSAYFGDPNWTNTPWRFFRAFTP